MMSTTVLAKLTNELYVVTAGYVPIQNDQIFLFVSFV
jgi:septum formation topological specificity factor MinE